MAPPNPSKPQKQKQGTLRGLLESLQAQGKLGPDAQIEVKPPPEAVWRKIAQKYGLDPNDPQSRQLLQQQGLAEGNPQGR